jgi:hypothetical protein
MSAANVAASLPFKDMFRANIGQFLLATSGATRGDHAQARPQDFLMRNMIGGEDAGAFMARSDSKANRCNRGEPMRAGI